MGLHLIGVGHGNSSTADHEIQVDVVGIEDDKANNSKDSHESDLSDDYRSRKSSGRSEDETDESRWMNEKYYQLISLLNSTDFVYKRPDITFNNANRMSWL